MKLEKARLNERLDKIGTENKALTRQLLKHSKNTSPASANVLNSNHWSLPLEM